MELSPASEAAMRGMRFLTAIDNLDYLEGLDSNIVDVMSPRFNPICIVARGNGYDDGLTFASALEGLRLDSLSYADLVYLGFLPTLENGPDELNAEWRALFQNTIDALEPDDDGCVCTCDIEAENIFAIVRPDEVLEDLKEIAPELINLLRLAAVNNVDITQLLTELPGTEEDDLASYKQLVTLV